MLIICCQGEKRTLHQWCQHVRAAALSTLLQSLKRMPEGVLQKATHNHLLAGLCKMRKMMLLAQPVHGRASLTARSSPASERKRHEAQALSCQLSPLRATPSCAPCHAWRQDWQAPKPHGQRCWIRSTDDCCRAPGLQAPKLRCQRCWRVLALLTSAAGCGWVSLSISVPSRLHSLQLPCPLK